MLILTVWALQACVYDARVQVEGMQVIRNLVWGKSEEQNAVASAGLFCFCL